MSTRIVEFKRAIYREHLEEASALYDLRMAKRTQPDANWRSLLPFEERIEAHVDALVVGGALALDVCTERMRECDAGELFAVLCVLCRLRRADLFAELWRGFDFEATGRVRAVVEALKLELPSAWIGACAQAVERGPAALFGVIAVAAAYRRLPLGHLVAARLNAASASAEPAAVWALTRFDADAASVGALERCWAQANTSIRKHALVGLLRTGSRSQLQAVHLLAQTEDWPHLALGLGGGRRAASLLREQIETGKATNDTLLGLALLGDVTTVRALQSCLTDKELAQTAALALHTITGAKLRESIFVVEAVDESELFPIELERWHAKREPPSRADGQPFGERLELLSCDPLIWERWLTANAQQFDPAVRYRLGRPYAARGVLETLVDPQSPERLRALAREELTVRFGCTLPMETDLPVIEQYTALRAIAHWIKANEANLQVGGW